MATGGSQEDGLHVCAVCQGKLRDPKFLPCYHTFCAPCIQDLADRHTGSSFPCPSCRRKFTLPSGGVVSLQTNFYILPQTAQHPSGSPVMCTRHPDEKLRFCCVQCDEAISKPVRHEGHPTDNLTLAANDKRKELLTDKRHVQDAMFAVKEELTSLREERQLWAKKRATIEKNICDRHATVVAIADRQRDEALSSLQAVDTDLDKDVGGALEQREGDLVQLEDPLQLRDDAVTSGTDSDIITVATEMSSGRGSPQKVQALTSPEERTLQGPVLHFDVSTDIITQAICGYLGSVRMMEVERRPEVKVTERFRCAQDPDVEIFSLCHRDTDPPVVTVSYERCGMKKDPPVKTFTETGQCVRTGAGNQVGKVSYKRHAKGRCMYATPVTGRFRTYNKSPTAEHIGLNNKLSGQADIDTVTVTSTHPFKDEAQTQFTIQVGPHRAFDVDDSGRYFAVVEEGKESTARRCVRLYRRSVERVICTYSPPNADDCQPSDVCFHTLGGQKVLLITDEMIDNVHVVTIEGDTLRFQRYLCESSPSLIQPMAITVDVQGRLWVGCRGGAVLTIEQMD